MTGMIPASLMPPGLTPSSPTAGVPPLQPTTPSPVSPAIPQMPMQPNDAFGKGQAQVRQGDAKKEFPANYAHPVSQWPLSQVVPNVAHAAVTAGKVATYKPVKDHELANMDDFTKRAGSLGIATMATLGLGQRIFGVGEFLGFASWFGAMALTPRIINAVVKLKTGVDLNQMYLSTYGQRQNLYKDPNYLPLHILPDDVINRAADKLGVPKDALDRRKETEEKIRQVSVQAHTWWMLVAGPATPVISGAIADQLQDPLTRSVNALRLGLSNSAVRHADNPEKLSRHSQAVLNRMLGEIPESQLSSWWKSFGKGVIKASGLKKGLSIKDVVDSSQDALTDKVAAHFAQLDAAGQAATHKYIQEQGSAISRLQSEAERFLGTLENEGRLDAQTLRRHRNFVEARIDNAQSTLRHYGKLLEVLRATAGMPEEVRLKEIRRTMRTPVLAEVQRMVDAGYRAEAERVAGSSKLFQKVWRAADGGRRQFDKAFKLMGASPDAHLGIALRDVMLRKLWQRRILGYLGGGLLASTAVYTMFFVGRDFKKREEA